MDKEWTKLPRYSNEYIEGVHQFLDFAYTNGRPQGDELLCPCAKCRNQYWTTRDVILDHLIAKGFLKGYVHWVHHGEQIQRPTEIGDEEDSHDDTAGLLYDTFREVAEADGVYEDARKFYRLINQKMKKEANLKKKMNATHKGEEITSSFQLPQVKSSTELLKHSQIGREKIISNLGGPSNNQHKEKGIIRPSFVLASKEQFLLSNFAATGQANENLKNVLHPTKKTSSIGSKTQHSVQDPTRQPMKKSVLEGDNSKTKQQLLEKRVSHYDKFMARQQSLKKTVATHDNSKANQKLMERIVGVSDNSMASQQPLKRTVATSDKSSANQHPNKKVVAENSNSRSKQHPLKRAMAVNDSSRANQQPNKRVVAENDNSSGGKKAKRVPMCASMSIDEFLKENEQVDEEEEVRDETEEEELDIIEQEENVLQEEDGRIIETSKKRTRGPTRCLKIHSRPVEEREDIILDSDGEPIGPNDKIVSDLSLFLGTIARNADFCPLIYTNFKALIKNHKEDMWEYVNHKYKIPEKGEKAVFSRINDAWRQYKSKIKKNHFLKYSTLKERLKHRPQSIPEAHFRQLMTYWRSGIVQDIAKKNAMNKAKQKYLHHTGPVNFARIRAKLQANKKNAEEVNQAEMFIETRKSQKGKEVDEETQYVIDKLQGSIQESNESTGQTFRSLFGKEKPGRVRCYGRTATPSQLKRNEEIAAIKKEHENEVNTWKKKVQGMEVLLRYLFKQNNPDLDDEAFDTMMANAAANEDSVAPHSSTSTHIPNLEKVGEGEEGEGEEE